MEMNLSRTREDQAAEDTQNEYSKALRDLPTAQDIVRRRVHLIRQYEGVIRERIAAHDPTNPATAYTIERREKDAEHLQDLKSKLAHAEQIRDKFQAVITKHEMNSANVQYSTAMNELRSIADTSRPVVRRALSALETFLESLDQLKHLSARTERIINGNLRLAKRSMPVTSIEPLPEIITASQIIEWLRAELRCNVNARYVPRSLQETFPSAFMSAAQDEVAQMPEPDEQPTPETDTATPETIAPTDGDPDDIEEC